MLNESPCFNCTVNFYVISYCCLFRCFLYNKNEWHPNNYSDRAAVSECQTLTGKQEFILFLKKGFRIDCLPTISSPFTAPFRIQLFDENVHCGTEKVFNQFPINLKSFALHWVWWVSPRIHSFQFWSVNKNTQCTMNGTIMSEGIFFPILIANRIRELKALAGGECVGSM